MVSKSKIILIGGREDGVKFFDSKIAGVTTSFMKGPCVWHVHILGHELWQLPLIFGLECHLERFLNM